MEKVKETFEQFVKEAEKQAKITLTKLAIGYGKEGLKRTIDKWAKQKKWIYELFAKSENYIGNGRIRIIHKTKNPIDVNAIQRLNCTPARDLIKKWTEEEGWDNFNEYLPDGRKKSRVMIKYCKDWYNEHNVPGGELSGRQEAIIGDAFKTTREEEILLSINPVDYLTMSNGESYMSCANLDIRNLCQIQDRCGNNGGCGTGGVISYLIDSSTIVAYKKGKPDEGGRGIERKIYRILVHFSKTKVIYDRLYPQDSNQKIKNKITATIQREMENILGAREKWDIEVYTYLNDGEEYDNKGWQYNDLNQSYCLPIIYRSNEDTGKPIEIGATIDTVFGIREMDEDSDIGENLDITSYSTYQKLRYTMDEYGIEKPKKFNYFQDKAATDAIELNGIIYNTKECIRLNGEWCVKNDLIKTATGYCKPENVVELYHKGMTYQTSKAFAEKFIEIAENTYITSDKELEKINEVFYLENGQLYKKDEYIKIKGELIKTTEVAKRCVYMGGGMYKLYRQISQEMKDIANKYHIGNYVKNEDDIVRIDDEYYGIKPVMYKGHCITKPNILLAAYAEQNEIDMHFV